MFYLQLNLKIRFTFIFLVTEVKAHFETLEIKTTQKIELVNITRQVEEAARRSGVENGLCLVYAPHATAAIIANEDEEGLKADIVKWIREFFPHDGKWRHNLIDDNAAAHLASSMLTSSRLFPVRGGRLIRGTWQSIFLVELDGPRTRRVVVEVLGL